MTFGGAKALRSNLTLLMSLIDLLKPSKTYIFRGKSELKWLEMSLDTIL